MFLDRLTALLGFVVVGITAVAYALGMVGTLLLGPVLILSAVTAYTLWTLWWGVTDSDGDQADTSLQRTWMVGVAVAVVSVLLAIPATGFGLSLGTPDAHMTAGLIAGDSSDLTVSGVGAGTALDAPGWTVRGEQSSFDGGRVGVAAIGAFSNFGNSVAHRMGIVFAAIGLLSWGAVAVRRVPTWAAALMIVAIAATPAVGYASVSGSPGIVAFGTIGLAVWALVGVVEAPTTPRAAIAGVLLALSAGAVPAAGWAAAAGVSAWAGSWLVGPSGWIERDRRRRMVQAMGLGALPVFVLVAIDALVAGRAGDLFAETGIAVLAGGIVGGAALAWHRTRIRRPPGPLPLLVVLMAIPVSLGTFSVTTLGVTGAWAGPSVDAWIGVGPVLVGMGLIGWVWWSDRQRDPVVELNVTLGLVAATVALLGPLTLLPGGFDPFVPVVVPALAAGAAWLVAELFRDPERAVFQTLAIVLAVALVVVPVWMAWDRVGAEPQPGGVAAVSDLCDVIDPRSVVVVVGDDARLAGSVAGGVAAYCGVSAVAGDVSGDVESWRAAAVAVGSPLVVVGLDGAAPPGLELGSGPVLELERWTQTIGDLPTGYDLVTIRTTVPGQ